MSNLEVVQRIVPNANNLNFHTSNPYDINVNVVDPKTLKGYDRQDQEEEKRKKNPQAGQKRGCQSRARRILVGKDEEEERYEKKHHQRLNWFKNEVRRHVAEFIGSFLLIFFVCGIRINHEFYPDGEVANVDKGLASGFVRIGLIFSFGKVSGAHFNPCVTLAFLLRGAFNFYRFITYIIFQFAGAVAAAAVLYDLFGIYGHLGTTTPGDGLENENAFGVEIILTFLYITVILVTAENASSVGSTAGLAVGTTYAAIEILGSNFSGASVNPWRTIAPTMIANYAWSTYWIYLAGPVVGTILAVLVQRLMVTGIPIEVVQNAGQGSGKNDNSHD